MQVFKEPEAYYLNNHMTKGRYKNVDLTRVPEKVKAEIKSHFFIRKLTSL